MINLERPGGDYARTCKPFFLEGETLRFLAVNRNKERLVLDQNRPE